MMEPRERAIEKRWAAPRAKFEALCQRLETGEALDMTHSGVESMLDADGKELLRLLLQDHLTLRAKRETAPSQPLTGRDGIARTHLRRHVRPLETLFGTVDVSRLGLGQRGVASLHPLDAELNLPVERYSFGVRRRVAEAAAMGSFDAAVATLAATTAASVPKRQAEELARRAAQDFEAFYDAKAETPDKPGAIVVMSLDGKGVVMRTEDLKAATRKRALATTHKRQKRLSPGEKRNSKRIATVATVYTIDKQLRTPREVALGRPGERLPAPRPIGKRVWASLERSIEQVVAEMFDEAFRQDPAGVKVWVCLTDGNHTQIRLVKERAQAAGMRLAIVLDIIHVLEYLWKAVAVFFPNTSTPAAETWVTERLLRILKGESGLVAAGMRRAATKRGLSKAARKPIDACAGYLHSHREYLRYHLYLRHGFPIATGVIEGACRYLIKDRMDVTGARWSLAGAEAVLKLRALKASGDFAAYWTFHEARELERNHTSHYATIIPFKRPERRQREELRRCTA